MKLGYSFVGPPKTEPFLIHPRISGAKDSFNDVSEESFIELQLSLLLAFQAVALHYTQSTSIINNPVALRSGLLIAINFRNNVTSTPITIIPARQLENVGCKIDAAMILLKHACKSYDLKSFRGQGGSTKEREDLITSDSEDTEWAGCMGLPKDRDMLVTQDRFTGIVQAVLLKGKDSVLVCEVAGGRRVLPAYAGSAAHIAGRDVLLPGKRC